MALLNESSGIPLYVQVVEALTAKIAAGQYLPGQRIPPEAELCTAFGVSRITIRQAIRKLVDQRVLSTKQGKGTFVNAVKIRHRLPELYSFSEDMREAGLEPSSRVLEQRVIDAEAEDARLLALPPSDGRVNWIVRVRMANKVPILIERCAIPHYLCPDLVTGSFEHVSLYALLTEKYHLEMSRGEETYEVCLLAADEARELSCRRGEPAFAIRRLAFGKNGTPLELTRSVGRGDLMRFTAQLTTHEFSFSRSVDITGFDA